MWSSLGNPEQPRGSGAEHRPSISSSAACWPEFWGAPRCSFEGRDQGVYHHFCNTRESRAQSLGSPFVVSQKWIPFPTAPKSVVFFSVQWELQSHCFRQFQPQDWAKVGDFPEGRAGRRFRGEGSPNGGGAGLIGEERIGLLDFFFWAVLFFHCSCFLVDIRHRRGESSAGTAAVRTQVSGTEAKGFASLGFRETE